MKTGFETRGKRMVIQRFLVLGLVGTTTMLGATPLYAQDSGRRDSGDAVLREAVRALLRDVERDGTSCAVAAVRLSDERAVFEHRAREAMAPASNQKVLTAIHVVRSLGFDHEFVTRFSLVRSGARGDDAAGPPYLRVESSGDPTLLRERSESSYFAPVATALERAGVREVAGIEFDAPAWTGPARPATWPQDQLDQPYAPPTGPFVLEEGCLVVEVRPTTTSSPANIVLHPSGLDVRALVRGSVKTTGSKKEGRSIVVARTSDGVRVSGAIWSGFGPSITRLADPDPQRSYEASLEAALAERGIRIAPARARALEAGAPAGAAHEAATQLCELRNPLRPALERLLVLSSNFQGEQLLRIVAAHEGGEASLEAGVAAMQQRFAGAKGSDGLVVVDGSGLSRGNRVTAALLAHGLASALLEASGKDLIACFPVAGRSGKLADRMQKIAGRVRAKTGWIRGVSALTGTVLTESDEVVVFSILMNYDPSRQGYNRKLTQAQDRIVEALYEHTRAAR